MTREEQINLYLKERNIPITSLEANSVIEGIKWADEHPILSEEEQVGMGELGMEWQKKHLIKKACKWLIQQKEMIGISFEEDFIERFKKAMKGGAE